MEQIASDAWAWLQLAAAWLWAVLASGTAQRLYAVTGAATLVGGSIWFARQQLRWIQDLAPESFRWNPGGPPASRIATLLSRIERAQQYADRRGREAVARLLLLVVSGFVVPTALLALGTYGYDWLRPDETAFLSLGEANAGAPVAQPSVSDAIAFALVQLPKGALSDLLEVFGWDWAPITNDPSNVIASSGVLAYRVLVGGFAVVFLIFAQKMAAGAVTVGQRIGELRRELQEARSAARG